MSRISLEISEASEKLLNELATQTGQSPSQVIDHALNRYQREVFFRKLNQRYESLRSQKTDWEQHQAEIREWDVALPDGLEPEEWSKQ